MSELLNELPRWEEALHRFHQGQLSAPELTAIYLLHKAKRQRYWWQGQRKMMLRAASRWVGFFAKHRVHGVSEDAVRGLCLWSEEPWRAEVFFR